MHIAYLFRIGLTRLELFYEPLTSGRNNTLILLHYPGLFLFKHFG